MEDLKTKCADVTRQADDARCGAALRQLLVDRGHIRSAIGAQQALGLPRLQPLNSVLTLAAPGPCQLQGAVQRPREAAHGRSAVSIPAPHACAMHAVICMVMLWHAPDHSYSKRSGVLQSMCCPAASPLPQAAQVRAPRVLHCNRQRQGRLRGSRVGRTCGPMHPEPPGAASRGASWCSQQKRAVSAARERKGPAATATLPPSTCVVSFMQTLCEYSTSWSYRLATVNDRVENGAVMKDKGCSIGRAAAVAAGRMLQRPAATGQGPRTKHWQYSAWGREARGVEKNIKLVHRASSEQARVGCTLPFCCCSELSHRGALPAAMS